MLNGVAVIPEFIARFDKMRPALLAGFREKHPDSYEGIFREVVCAMRDEETDGWGSPDPERITVIDHGEYQGTKLFVVAARGYQPSEFWTCLVSYGSCSACDTFEGIRSYGDAAPTEEQAQGYFMLALHMVQALRNVPE